MRLFPFALAATLLAACASPQSRIKKHQALFDAYPPEVQAKIKAGQAEIGFTPEQAQMALGAPAHVYTRKTTSGSQEVWGYGNAGGPRVGLGLGIFSGGMASYDVGVGVGTGSDYPDDRVRVVFENGRVTSVERRER